MKLAPGDHVKHSTVDVDGHPVSIEQFRGRHVLLMFFRYAACPMCNLRLHDFASEYPRLHANGLSAVAFFHSSAKAIKRNAGRRRYPFPLVPDPNQEIYRDFGVTTSWAGLLKSMVLPSFYWDWIRSMRYGFWGGVDTHMAKMPADFLIGPDGRVLLVHYAKDIGDHLPLADVERVLRIPVKPSTRSGRSRPPVPGHGVHLGAGAERRWSSDQAALSGSVFPSLVES